MRRTLLAAVLLTACAAPLLLLLPTTAQEPTGTLPGHNYSSTDDDNENYSQYVSFYWSRIDADTAATEYWVASRLHALYEEFLDEYSGAYGWNDPQWPSYCLVEGYSTEYTMWWDLIEEYEWHKEEMVYWWDTYEQYIGNATSY